MVFLNDLSDNNNNSSNRHTARSIVDAATTSGKQCLHIVNRQKIEDCD